MCPPFIGMEGRNGMANTVMKEGRDGGHAVKIGWYPSLLNVGLVPGSSNSGDNSSLTM